MLIEKYPIVLRTRLLLNRSTTPMAIFKSAATVIHLLFNHLRLIPGHKLLGVLIGVCELTAALMIQIFLRTAISVRRGLSER